MKIKNYLFIIFFFFGHLCMAQSDFSQAETAYKNNNFAEAKSIYLQLIEKGTHSFSLYYNLGNTYLKQNEIGNAIWAYQNANKISPDHKDVIHNINYINSEYQLTTDLQNAWYYQFLYGKSINFWTYSSIITAFLLALFLLYNKLKPIKKHQLLKSLITILLSLILILTIWFSNSHKDYLLDENYGVCTEQISIVFSSPVKDQELFELKEGQTFELIEDKDGWVNIKFDRKEGWIEKSNIKLY